MSNNFVVSKSNIFNDKYYIYSKKYNICRMIHRKDLDSISNVNIDIDDFFKKSFVITSKKNLKKISIVTIIVTNFCNMNCDYCYEKEGSFGKVRKIIDQNTINNIIEFLIKSYDEINVINFFGGEPFLAINEIEMICIKIKEAVMSGKLRKMPKFTIVTNGSILNDKIITILKKFKIAVSVSIDGFKSTHNLYRHYRDGSVTYDNIIKNLEQLKNIDVLSCIQTTYFKSYIKQKISICDIKNFYFNKYKIDNFIFNNLDTTNIDDEKFLKENFSLDEYYSLKGNSIKSNIQLFLDKGIIDSELSYSLNKILNPKRKDYFCSAGLDEIAVDMYGDIYPCRNFAPELETIGDKYKLGNVSDFDSSIFNIKRAYIYRINSIDDNCYNCDNINSC